MFHVICVIVSGFVLTAVYNVFFIVLLYILILLFCRRLRYIKRFPNIPVGNTEAYFELLGLLHYRTQQPFFIAFFAIASCRSKQRPLTTRVLTHQHKTA